VRVEGYSFELCGGTHCRASGQIGSFVITGERSIGSGTRRIEAVTGVAADRLLDQRLAVLDRAAEAVGARSVDALEERISALQDELRETRRRLREGGASGLPKPADVPIRQLSKSPLITASGCIYDFATSGDMRQYAKDLRFSRGSNTVFVGRTGDENEFIVTGDEDLVHAGINLGQLASGVAARFGGRGGGRADMAQGRLRNAEDVAAAQEEIERAVRDVLEQRKGA
ncbi:MAG TPA: DHHA1 domain-containing protein, partial [Candidatus Binatia bacterium]|nr:DHHA1 domain-containing protein [Candidatus Binatia bacterium]